MHVKYIFFGILLVREILLLGSIIDNSVIMCGEIINAADNVSANAPTNVMSTVSTNVTSTASRNFANKKVILNCYHLWSLCKT